MKYEFIQKMDINKEFCFIYRILLKEMKKLRLKSL